MKVEIFTVCEAANDANGKLNLLGSFDHLWAQQTPVTHPYCAVAMRLRFARIEEGNHRLKVTFADADGKLVIPSIEATVGLRFANDDSTTAANVILNIVSLKLNSFGEYTIDLAVDGRQEGSLPLYVQRMPEQRPA